VRPTYVYAFEDERKDGRGGERQRHFVDIVDVNDVTSFILHAKEITDIVFQIYEIEIYHSVRSLL